VKALKEYPPNTCEEVPQIPDRTFAPNCEWLKEIYTKDYVLTHENVFPKD